jgi:hypothetical protein
MKKLYILGFILMPFLIKAQSLQVLNAQANQNSDGSVTVESHADVKNTSSTEKIVRVERIATNLTSGHITYFCWDDCFAPNGTISGNDTIPAGGTTSIFISYLIPNSINGNSTVTYKYYDVNNPNDSTIQQFAYNVSTTTSTVEKTVLAKSISEVSAAYPNPASQYTRIDYDLSTSAREASIKFYNILGSEIRKVDLQGRQGSVSIDLDNMSEGMYLYSLVVNGKTVSTKKFIVKK